ncbi:MAG: sigma-70 family RNA polymerase sigma factor [Solirubrobacteraceae bacterium]
MPPSDDLLLRDLRTPRGEDAARALYRTYGRELFGFAQRRLGDRGLAEEVVQETFTNVWRHADTFDETRGSIRTWLYGIARNAIIDADRRRARRPPVASFEPDEAAGEGVEPIEQAVLRWQVQAAFDRLTADHREILRLAHFAGLSVQEIAERTGLPPGTVKSRTFYALRSLRLILDEMEVSP